MIPGFKYAGMLSPKDLATKAAAGERALLPFGLLSLEKVSDEPLDARVVSALYVLLEVAEEVGGVVMPPVYAYSRQVLVTVFNESLRALANLGFREVVALTLCDDLCDLPIDESLTKSLKVRILCPKQLGIRDINSVVLSYCGWSERALRLGGARIWRQLVKSVVRSLIHT